MYKTCLYLTIVFKTELASYGSLYEHCQLASDPVPVFLRN
jgi:hypothetical protein